MKYHHRISPATLLASLALFFSLTGAGIAASGYRITSLWQIAPKVRHALRGSPGPRGAVGPQGPQGPQGATGAQGPAGHGIDWSSVYLAWQQVPISPGNASVEVSAYCHAGDHAITGGFQAYAALITISEEMPAAYSPDGVYRAWGTWTVVGHFDPTHDPNAPAPDSGWVRSWALCAPTS